MQTFDDIKVAMAAYAAEHVPLANVKDNSVFQLIAEAVAKRMIEEQNVRGIKRMIVHGMPELTQTGVFHWLIELSGGDSATADKIIQAAIVDFYGQKAAQ